jgi:hypothetical protein
MEISAMSSGFTSATRLRGPEHSRPDQKRRALPGRPARRAQARFQLVSNAITVTPAAATQLVITTEPPSTVKVSTGFGLQASIEDA